MSEQKIYVIAVDATDRGASARHFAEICAATECIRVEFGKGEDPNVYVLYENEKRRDEAMQSFRDGYRTARAVYSPWIDREEDATYDDVR